MTITFQENNRVVLKDFELFDLEKTFECGQCFRFYKDNNGVWHGVAHKKEINLYQTENQIVMYPVSKTEFEQIWYNFFDLGRDYKNINKQLEKDKTLKNALEYSKGIRILKQDPWEALCSFIISQNNNIPRIKGIIKRLCECYGEKTGSSYSFPSADTIALLTVNDLAPLRSGFRAKYIIDAAKKVSSNEIDLSKISLMNSNSAREELTKIYGVGKKVADCTLLFGMGHINICPVDVWIKRALTVLFKGSFPKCAENYQGIAQQYIFYYARQTKLDI